MKQQPIDDFGVIVNDSEGQEPKELNIDKAILPIHFLIRGSINAWKQLSSINVRTLKLGRLQP